LTDPRAMEIAKHRNGRVRERRDPAEMVELIVGAIE
jgi:hypothetical protein